MTNVDTKTPMNNFSLNLLTFPVWWYTIGLKQVWQRAKHEFHFGLQQTGLLIFIHHLREPLYGDYTRSGRIISLLLRLLLLMAKLALFLLRLLVIAALILGYVLILPVILMMIILQILALH